MDIRILQLTEGAAQAEGTAVVIDVFRAFSLECYLASWGAAEIRPVGEIEEAFERKRSDPAAVLIGERGGAKYPGFDYGNSPCSIPPDAVRGRRVIHTTSAGTQGITHAVHAQDIITGSLVNAKAAAMSASGSCASTGESISLTPPHRRSTRGMTSGCASCVTDFRLSCT